MREYDEYTKIDDAEDEDSISAEPFVMMDDPDDIGVLSFGMEKGEAINLIDELFPMSGEIKSLKNIENQLSHHSVYHPLTHSNIKEILDYAMEHELIKFENDYYIRID